MAFRSEIRSVIYNWLWNISKLKLDSLDLPARLKLCSEFHILCCKSYSIIWYWCPYPWTFMCPLVCAFQLLIPHLFNTGPVLAYEKAAQRAENGQVPAFMLYQWKCLSHLNSVLIWLLFSFLGERLTLFKLTYNRSNKFYSMSRWQKTFILCEIALCEEKKTSLFWADHTLPVKEVEGSKPGWSCAKSASERSQVFLIITLSFQAKPKSL